MKLYGYILLFLIVIIILTSKTKEVEHFDFLSSLGHAVSSVVSALDLSKPLKEIENAVKKAGSIEKDIEDTLVSMVQLPIDVGVATKSDIDALKASAKANTSMANAADPLFDAAKDLLHEANNSMKYKDIIYQRMQTCRDAAKGIFDSNIELDDETSNNSTGIVSSTSGSLSQKNPLKCPTGKDKWLKRSPQWFQNGHRHVTNARRSYTKLKNFYKSQSETPQCKIERLALEKRIDADDSGDIVTAEETQRHVMKCYKCFDKGIMLLQPANQYMFDKIKTTIRTQTTSFNSAINDMKNSEKATSKAAKDNEKLIRYIL